MKAGKIILKASPHIIGIMTAMLITLYILDYFNPLMGFLSRGMSKTLMGIWVACILIFTAAKMLQVIQKL